jgi:hypothetical protein
MSIAVLIKTDDRGLKYEIERGNFYQFCEKFRKNREFRSRVQKNALITVNFY